MTRKAPVFVILRHVLSTFAEFILKFCEGLSTGSAKELTKNLKRMDIMNLFIMSVTFGQQPVNIRYFGRPCAYCQREGHDDKDFITLLVELLREQGIEMGEGPLV